MGAHELVPDESSAYHEAGHAVAAVAVGVEVVRVTLRECSTPPAPFADRLRRPTPESAYRDAVIGLAGVVAQDLFRGEADPTERTRRSCEALLSGRAKYPTFEDWQTEDYGRAVSRLFSAFEGDVDRTRQAIHAAIDEALALLRERWEAVTVLATALWSGRTLTGAAVEAALAGSER